MVRLPETGNELPAYWRLPLRGIYSRPECFFVFLAIFPFGGIARINLWVQVANLSAPAGINTSLSLCALRVLCGDIVLVGLGSLRLTQPCYKLGTRNYKLQTPF